MSEDRSADEVIDEGSTVRRMLLYAFLPFWFVPGMLDWYYHRKTKIEETSGTRESLVHSVMFASVGVPVSLALLFEIDGFTLASAALGAAVHEALTLYDVSYAFDRRYTGPAEQHVHSFLEVMPCVGAFLLAGTHPRAFRDLRERPWTAAVPQFRRKKHPVPPAYLAAFFGAVALLIVAPYTEEFVRCYRAFPSLEERPAKPLDDEAVD